MNQRFNCTFREQFLKVHRVKKNKLSDCADREHIEKFEADEYHSADHDVRATAEIFFSMAEKIMD
jgi:DNA polymerase III epsilon subunit-like protein